MEAPVEPVLPAHSWNPLPPLDRYYVPDRDAYVEVVRFRNGVSAKVQIDRYEDLSSPGWAMRKLRDAVDLVAGEWFRLGKEDRDW
jgi:hypothetical protein